jgi:hypothetical protein
MIATAGRRPLSRSVSASARAPMQPISSSWVKAKWSGRSRTASVRRGAMMTAAAMNPFMSQVPRP